MASSNSSGAFICDLSWDSMNSQLKDALNEFISSNASAIESAMENANRDLAKDEPAIQDLVNYLSCSTPHSCTKDSQTVSISCESNLNLTQLVHFKSSQPTSKSESSHSSIGDMCASGSETRFSADTRQHLLMPDQHLPDCQQHHESYQQNNTLFPYSVNQSSCADSISNVNLSSSMFDSPRDHLGNETQVSPLVAASETQYFHSKDSVQFHFATDTSTHYSLEQNPGFPNTENGTGQFQNISQLSSDGFKDSTMLTSSFTSSASSEMLYRTAHDNLGYGLMDVIQASVSNVDPNASLMKVPEEMHTDESEVTYKQTAVSTNRGQHQTAQMQTLGAHLQSYCSDSFNFLSALDNAQASAPSNSDLLGCGLERNLNDTAESHSSADSNSASVGTAQTSTVFDLNVNTYQSSPFTSQNFEENIVEPTPAQIEVSALPSPCPVNSVNSDTTNISQQSGSAGFSVSSSPNSACFSHSSSYLSPHQSNQYQDSPTHNHSSSNIPDGLKISATPSITYLAELSQNHQLYHNNFDSPSHQHPQSSHLSSFLDLDQYKQNLNAGFDYSSNASVVHSLDQHLVTYQSNTASPMNISVPFSQPSPDDLNQRQHHYVTSSSAQTNEPSDFMKCTSVATEMASINPVCSSQTITEYTRSDSSNQSQPLINSSKSPSDVTMRELTVGGNVHSFSPLDLQTVVNSFGANESISTASQNCSGTSLIFSQASNTVVESNAHFNSSQQGQSVEGMASYVPSSSVTTFASNTLGQNTVQPFGSSTFDLTSGSQVSDVHYPSQMSSENYPQPMQVQESHFLNKISGLGASFSHCSSAANENTNTETSMDTSSGLGDNHDNISHRISFEEIHMSIVKAGDRLSQELCGTKLEQNMLGNSSHSLVGKTEPAECFSDMLSFRDLGTYQTQASDIGSSNITSDNIRMTSAISVSESSSLHSSESMQLSGSFNSNGNTTYILTNSTPTSASLPDLSADHNLIASILSNTQLPTATSNQLQLQGQITNQIHLQGQITNQHTVTVPNFLESTRSLLTDNIAGSNDHLNLMPSTDVTEGHQQIHYVVTTTSATPSNSETVVSSSDNKFSGASMVTSGTAQNILQSSSFRNDNSLQASQGNPILSLNLAGTTVSDSAPSSEMSSQMTSSGGKTSTLSNTLNNAVLLDADALHGSNGSWSEMASLGMSAGNSSGRGNPNPGMTDLSNTQPHIIMSLDDLQKLLLQQKLPHSSSPVLHQLPHGAVLSPQAFVLQKHASHFLRQSQPRLMVRGMALSGSSSHGMHPHQQILHTRDRSQLLVHKTQPSEHVSTTEEASQRNPEHAVILTDQESHQKFNTNIFQIPVISQKDQHQTQLKPMEKQSQPNIQLQLKQNEVFQQQQKQQTINLILKEIPKPEDDQLAPMQCVSQQQLDLLHAQQQAQIDQKNDQNNPSSQQQIQNVISLSLKQEELKQLQKQEKEQDLDGQQKTPFHLQLKQYFQSMEQPDRVDRPCNDSLKNEYKHLHSLLTGDPAAVSCQTANTQAKAPQSSQPKDSDVEMVNIMSQTGSVKSQSVLKVEDPSSTKGESDTARDGSSYRQTSLLAQILTDRKRCHTPLSVGLTSPTNSNSEGGSPLPSPTYEDGNTQLTLIERSASLNIKSDHLSCGDDDENAIFDLNAFHKRPSADESHSSREENENVPMKIAKPSIDADARSSINPPSSPEPKFDFGSAISSTSHFSFAFGNKDINNPGMFTFGSSGTVVSSSDSQQYKDGSNHNRPSCSKPVAKAVGMRSAIPTQPVRPTSRRQKEYSLKACYPSKVDGVELKILAQPEPQHRARYQTEGSRGAIKDESQQGYPIIKLFGYSRATKLQVYIGDEGGRVKPHGFYQACRVSGKNSNACAEQEIEGTTVLELDLLPENNMTVKANKDEKPKQKSESTAARHKKLDCIGILKLRNADVERRIGPKRARDKKKTNTRARLVMRCSFEKSDGRQYFLQVTSNPIVCTQPVGQPEISRMSLSECSIRGGDSLFIIGKNFRNKGTSVLFQTLDSADDYVTWQAEAEIEQEFFQPTHIICKIPPYKDQTIKIPQEAQIVVSCADKMSDPHSFIYQPVYHMVSSVKQEALMETDVNVTTRPLPFVSPEALHLNRMVQQTHAQSSASTSLFQLPAGTIPDMHTAVVKSPPTHTSFKGLRPAVLTNLNPAKSEVSVTPVCSTAESFTSILPVSSTSVSFASVLSNNNLAGTLPHLTQPVCVFGEKYNGLVQKSSSQHVMALPVSSSTTNGATVNNIGHSSLTTKATSFIQPAISNNHSHLPLVSAISAGPTVHTDLPSAVTTSFPSAPFFLVVDPAAFQSSTGGDKIQQLLLQILETQSKLI